MSHNTVMVLIMAVTLITWLGVFLYILNIDKSLRRVELSLTEKEQDEL